MDSKAHTQGIVPIHMATYSMYVLQVTFMEPNAHCTGSSTQSVNAVNRECAVTAATNPLLNQNTVAVVLNRPTSNKKKMNKNDIYHLRYAFIFGIYFIALRTDNFNAINFHFNSYNINNDFCSLSHIYVSVWRFVCANTLTDYFTTHMFVCSFLLAFLK